MNDNVWPMALKDFREHPGITDITNHGDVYRVGSESSQINIDLMKISFRVIEKDQKPRMEFYDSFRHGRANRAACPGQQDIPT